jgi:predicted nucleic acid-binding protein
VTSSIEPQGCAPARERLIVVDTNVWLDLHYFRDPQAQPLAAALESGRWTAARCGETDAELTLVLQRPPFCSDPVERLRLLDCLQAWQAGAAPFALGGRAPWRCRDPHDQKFLDLVYVARATLLLTKDKALLALRGKAQRDRLMILTPAQFAVDLLHLDEGPQPVERLIPLVRDPIQVSAGLVQPPRLQHP